MSKENTGENLRVENQEMASLGMENLEKKSRINRKTLALAIVVILMIGVGAAVGIGIYNMPEKRITRQLQLGYKYLEEGNYEKAALAFEQVIAVDKKCIEAYAKGIEAYIKSGNEESLKDLFERAMEQIRELDEELLVKNIEHIIDICLSVKDVYGGDAAHMEESLEKEREVLSVFDRLLELDGGNMRVLAGLADCLNAYIEVLMNAERYDEVRALADKYAQIPGVDFSSIIRRIEELTRPEEEQPVEEPIEESSVDEPTVEESSMEEKPLSYTVQFRTSGGSAVEAQTVEYGSAAKLPKNPTRDGYIFAGWYADANTTKAWDFSQTVTADITLYAKWEKNETKREYITIAGRTIATDVKELSLSGCGISDISELSKLTNLTWLNLEYNRISDISALGKLTNLTILNLDNNQISDISVLGNLKNLTILDLDNNQISDISVLGKLTNLTRLTLGQNQISDISVIGTLTNLMGLGLGRNQISDISVLEPMVRLTDLLLYDNQISDISVLGNLKNLTYLGMSNNQISDISVLGNLKNLTYLGMSNNQISDISALSSLTNLEELELPINQIGDISALGSLTNLTRLHLGVNQIRNISVLGNLKNLTELYLNNNPISGEQISELRAALPNCDITY